MSDLEKLMEEVIRFLRALFHIFNFLKKINENLKDEFQKRWESINIEVEEKSLLEKMANEIFKLSHEARKTSIPLGNFF